jgi:hypothetical protein
MSARVLCENVEVWAIRGKVFQLTARGENQSGHSDLMHRGELDGFI